MKKFLMLMILVIATIFLGSSCGENHTQIPSNPTPTFTNTATPSPTTPPQRISLTPEEIRKLGEDTTVFITGREKGSGVIIDKQDNTYYVLTAAHVVGIEPGEGEYPDATLEIKNNEKNIFSESQINYHKDVDKFPENTDLAVIKFTAKPGQEYKVASLGKSIFPGMPVYAFGWTSCFKGEPPELEKQFQKTEGEICKINPDRKNGRNVSYTNNIIGGMSGGPVFNSTGHLIAIQAGQGGDTGQTSDNNCTSLPLQPDPKFNYGRGVPIRENFEMLQSKVSNKLEIKLPDDLSAQKKPTDNIKCPEKPPANQCPPILSPGKKCNPRLCICSQKREIPN